jgi:hypothetical protein
MNKYQIGQKVYFIRYHNKYLRIYSFIIEKIKRDERGYRYSYGEPGARYMHHENLFLSKEQAVQDSCNRLRNLLNE